MSKSGGSGGGVSKSRGGGGGFLYLPKRVIHRLIGDIIHLGTITVFIVYCNFNLILLIYLRQSLWRRRRGRGDSEVEGVSDMADAPSGVVDVHSIFNRCSPTVLRTDSKHEWLNYCSSQQSSVSNQDGTTPPVIFVVGTAGAGKSSLVTAFQRWARFLQVDVLTINLDPGLKKLWPNSMCEICFLSDVMDEYDLGPMAPRFLQPT